MANVKHLVRGVCALILAALLFVSCGGAEQPVPVQESATSTAATTAPVSTVGAEPTQPPAPTATLPPTPAATAAPTARTSPTPAAPAATPSPAPDPTPSAAPFDSRVWQTALFLAEELSPRESATDEELAAANYLAGELSELGYEVDLQPFEAVELYNVSRLAVHTPNVAFTDAPGEHPYAAQAWLFAMPLDPASFEREERRTPGELVYVSEGLEAGLEGVDLRGKVVLVRRGASTLGDTVDRAAEAGAAAVVIVRSGDFLERIARDVDIPAIALYPGQELGLVRALHEGTTVDVEVVSLELDPKPSRNVIAGLDNDIDGDRVLVIGAHYDTTPESPGANDNGTGVAALLVVAQELADADLPFDLRFVLFGAEETGLNGSFHYVHALEAAEASRILAMINVDSVGTGRISAVASVGMESLARGSAEALGIRLADVDVSQFLGSDHLPFQYAGVDFLVLSADRLDYINSPQDTIEHLDPTPMGQAAAIVLEMLERLSADHAAATAGLAEPARSN